MASHARSVSAVSESLDNRTRLGSEQSLPESPSRFVICVDYGTTFTGVAWILTQKKAPTLKDINVVHQWPGLGADGAHSKPKVPSVFTYSPSTGQKWGFDVVNRAYVIKWSKLKLEKPTRLSALNCLKDTLDEARTMNFDPRTERTEIPRHLLRTSVEIVTAYLLEVLDHTRRTIENKQDPLSLQQYPIDLVITHPALWSYRARNLTFRAVMKAFRTAFKNIPYKLGSVRLATEPEACAQHTLQAARGSGMIDNRHLRVGECLTVVDAGGGTVDVVSYRIDQITPTFRITKITAVGGGPHGATAIDRAFLSTLDRRLGLRLYRRLLQIGGAAARHGRANHAVLTLGEQFMLDRFEDLKKGFKGSMYRGQPQPDMVLGVPEELTAMGNDYVDEDDAWARDIRSGALTMTCQDMEGMFRDSIVGIYNLMEHQRVLVEEQGLTVGSVFLSGGFSTNEYLYECILELTRSWHINLIRSQNAWIDVSKGGVLMGLGMECRVPPPVTACPYSFGVVISKHFALYDHADDKRYKDTLDKQDRARDHIEWVVSKGDLLTYNGVLEKEVKLVRKFTQNTTLSGKVTLLVSDADARPDVFSPTDSSHQVVSIDFDLASLPADMQVARSVKMPDSQKTYNRLELQLEISVSQDRADIQLVCGKVPDVHGRPTFKGYVLASADPIFLS